jgi:hypothetical protein
MLSVGNGGRAPVCLMRGRLPRRLSPRRALAAPRPVAITGDVAACAEDGAEGLRQVVRQLLLERDTMAVILAWSTSHAGALPPGCFMV